MNIIEEFRGEYRWLSNFWPSIVSYDGYSYPSVENAYQAAKFPAYQRTYFFTCSAAEAKRGSRVHSDLMDPFWEFRKVEVMKQLLAQKFTNSNELGSKLVSTNTLYIVEGNTWGDTFWGVCRGVGKNVLGQLLMSRRQELIKNGK